MLYGDLGENVNLILNVNFNSVLKLMSKIIVYIIFTLKMLFTTIKCVNKEFITKVSLQINVMCLL